MDHKKKKKKKKSPKLQFKGGNEIYENLQGGIGRKNLGTTFVHCARTQIEVSVPAPKSRFRHRSIGSHSEVRYDVCSSTSTRGLSNHPLSYPPLTT
jgi:hypothetical protein